ncbi:MAG: hypothetical protein DWQ02_12390 [Bacteroidetes bacterium]|nr:MAG: hypothetical protein DWQ02_12390 [Bacteroidota bacterium]
MKIRILIPVLFAFISLASKCEEEGKLDMFCQQWEFVSSKDPYQGGTISEADPANKQFRVFKKDGSYREFDNDNDATGIWAFNQDSTKIGTVIETQNGQPTGNPLEITDHRWEIRDLTSTKLVLAIQGRHGFVEHTYKSVK